MPPSQPAGRRGPKRSLTLDAIAAGALDLADRSGLEALTMKRLATALGVGEMTLYGYVRTKEEILEALTDQALSEVTVPTKGPWDRQLRQLFIELHDVLVRHPCVAYLDRTRPTSGVSALRIADRALALLEAAGVDDDTAFIAHRALHSYTISAALFHASRRDPLALGDRRVLMLALAQDYPHLVRHADRFATEGSRDQLNKELTFGLDLLIDAVRNASISTA